MALQDMNIPYPSQHTMLSNHRPASEMPFKCFRCCIAKKEERKAGEGCGRGWVGDRLESPVEKKCFVACVVVVFVRFFFFFFFGGGGGG